MMPPVSFPTDLRHGLCNVPVPCCQLREDLTFLVSKYKKDLDIRYLIFNVYIILHSFVYTKVVGV